MMRFKNRRSGIVIEMPEGFSGKNWEPIKTPRKPEEKRRNGKARPNYATVNDIIALKRPLTADEQERAAALIPVISSTIRYEAKKQGKDFDELVRASEDLANVAKAVTADVVMRELNTPAGQLPATSYNESAGGISQSYALPNASGRIALWPSDLKTLGLKRQQIRILDMMGVN